jgi:hypothetical protein
MTAQDIIEEIRNFPVSDRIALIEQISQSLLADLKKEEIEQIRNRMETEEVSEQERAAAIDRLYGVAAIEGIQAPTDEEIKEDYTDYLAEKYS